MSEEILRPSLRNTGAVLVGLCLLILLPGSTDALLHSKGIFPALGLPVATALWVIAIVYRILFSFAAGWVTARLAQTPRLRSVYILSGISLAMGLLNVRLSLGHADLVPLWYPVAVAITSPLAALLGGKLLIAKRPA